LLVELLPGPLDDDDSAAARERAGDPVEHLSGIGYVVK
jgi:hypothetical protein